MSTAMLAWAVTGGYGIAWLVTARLLFGWWRSRGMTAKLGRYCREHGKQKDAYGHIRQRNGCCLDKPVASDGALAALAMTAAILWPVALLAAVIRVKPAATPAERAALAREREAERERLLSRNAELERELGIAGDRP